MNLYETIDFIKTELEKGKNDRDDLLFGYNIITDPWADLSKNVPLLLIDGERTEFFNRAEYGTPTDLDHVLTFTMFESAKGRYDEYKPKINVFAKNLIDKLISIDDHRIRKCVPQGMSHAEMIIDSLKVTGIVIEIKIRTDWED
jgi:hypothetical protein